MRLTTEQHDRLLSTLRQDLGEVVAHYLLDESCEDIVLNPDGCLWVKSLASGWEIVGTISPSEAIGIITSVAFMRGLEVNHEKPILETILPVDGSRFEGAIPPIVVSPVFQIRSRAKQIFTLEEYVSARIVTAEQVTVLRGAIENRKTILISGSPGAGKTTLLNACIQHLAAKFPAERVGLIEDTPELQCDSRNSTAYLATGATTMLDCLKACLRGRFDRLIVGETRGPEALVMLKAFNTGHPGGFTTVHANSADSVMLRLESLAKEAIATYDARPLIGESIDLIAHIDGPMPGANRRLAALVWVRKFSGEKNDYVLEPAG